MINQITIPVILVLLCNSSWSQNINNTDTSTYLLDEFVISANKTEEKSKFVSQQIQVIDAKQISSLNAQSSADLISSTGNVFVQKSQQGGGSPVLRGFEASRVLIVVDGVRMNNLIYRSGHLQNIITMDNASLERAEVVFGPASTIYGSDALGGVIHFFTKKPELSLDSTRNNVKINTFLRYSSVNNERTGHVDFNIGLKKIASFTSFTSSEFGDLKSGANQNPFYTKAYGERPYYVETINGKDSLVKNNNKYIQRFSGYSQIDFTQKFLYKQNEHISHGLNVQFSNSGNIPRYDRLTDPSGKGLKSAEWYYGPQRRDMIAYDMNIRNGNKFFQQIHFGVNTQYIEESRHNRNFNSIYRNNRIEKVQIVGINTDFNRVTDNHNIRTGTDIQLNSLSSKAYRTNILNNDVSKLDTRYPDGENTMNSFAAYFSHTWKINQEVVLNDGFRIGYTTLSSAFIDTTFFPLPYQQVQQQTPVYSGSIGIINLPNNEWKFSALLSSGFRVPNVDDLSKVFESYKGRVIVPNNNIKPEKTINSEIGITHYSGAKSHWNNTIYYTQFYDAIVTDKFKFNGNDSIMYDGILSEVYANQNKQRAYIYGISSGYNRKFSEIVEFNISANYTYGRIKTDSADTPLDHIPPFMAKIQLVYNHKKLSSQFFMVYNGWKKLKDYNTGGEDNLQYATPEGMPAWITANIRFSYKVNKYLTLQTGIDNIFDTQYRAFASGINAPGRNIFGTIRFNY